MTPMITAVELTVPEADNHLHLWRIPGIQTVGATAFDEDLAIIQVLVGFAQQTG
jgi:hypothetical protein